MTPVRVMTDEQLQEEWSAAQFFHGGCDPNATDPFEADMHREADARIRECEQEMARREPAQDSKHG